MYICFCYIVICKPLDIFYVPIISSSLVQLLWTYVTSDVFNIAGVDPWCGWVGEGGGGFYTLDLLIDTDFTL